MPYRAKKRLGQHFLISAGIARRIVDLCNLTPKDTCLEIGPGRGALTQLLADTGAAVKAIEFDRDLISHLESLTGSLPNVTVVNADFLHHEPPDAPFVLVGNLPYNLTSPVLDWCVRRRRLMVRAVLMIQKELAERVSGTPGTKAWSPLSIMTQLFFEVTSAFGVGPDAFRPQPKVDSAVIRLDPTGREPVEDPRLFERIVRASFSHRRKLLVNNLSSALNVEPQLLRETLQQLDMPVNSRAEQLYIDQFLSLTKHLRAATIV